MLQKLTAKISGQCFSKRNSSSAVISNQLIKATGPNLPTNQIQQTVNDLRVILPSALNHFKRTDYDEKTDLVFPVKSEYLSDIALEKDYKGKTYLAIKKIIFITCRIFNWFIFKSNICDR